ncbi:uncharacterized protein LOC141849497 [Brevipalpus obovatus]|uniref:uncharacterized protein LOC141849497 n=1 Tax=Brevipalpus obovatus TaxID=246614 RepID=UPI003D9E53A9
MTGSPVKDYQVQLFGDSIQGDLETYRRKKGSPRKIVARSLDVSFQRICDFPLGLANERERFITLDYKFYQGRVQTGFLQIREFYDYGSVVYTYPQPEGVSLRKKELAILPDLWRRADADRGKEHEENHLVIACKQDGSKIYIKNRHKPGIEVPREEIEEIAEMAPGWKKIFDVVEGGQADLARRMLYKMMLAQALSYIGLGQEGWEKLEEYLSMGREEEFWLRSKVSYNYYRHLVRINLVRNEDFAHFVTKSTKFGKILRISQQDVNNIATMDEWREIFHVICYKMIKIGLTNPQEEWSDLFILMKAMKLLDRHFDRAK